jgi:hypothetical protein
VDAEPKDCVRCGGEDAELNTFRGFGLGIERVVSGGGGFEGDVCGIL